MPLTPAQLGYKEEIANILRARYFPIIQASNPNQNLEDQDKNRLSKSLAALAIEKKADVSVAEAANAVVDGGDDNGIDSICFNPLQKKLWITQSKVGDAPGQHETLAFCRGIRNLFALNFDGVNRDFLRLQPIIETALDTTGVTVVAVITHRGEGMGPHAIQALNELKTELNRIVQRFDWLELNVDGNYALFADEHVIEPVRTTLNLQNWHHHDVPRRAFYGLVSANELVRLYQAHGRGLFEKNIRYYLGSEEVNEAIKQTVIAHPEELLYLNNGLTAICSSISLPPAFTQQEAILTLEGLSIVNGAQTVGSINQAATENNGILSENAKVLITLIEVGEDPQGIDKKITRARNTQNAIKFLHFIALDPQQERLRREMMVAGVVYQYRPSEDDLAEAIHVEDAALALAALQPEINIVVAAKKSSGNLYDTSGEIYPRLFSNQLSGRQLIRKVRVHRYLSDIFDSSRIATDNARQKALYKNCGLLVMNIMTRLHSNLVNKPEIAISHDDQLEFSRIGIEIAEGLFTTGERTFGGTKGYLSISRNLTDMQQLFANYMADRAQVAANQHAAENNQQQNNP